MLSLNIDKTSTPLVSQPLSHTIVFVYVTCSLCSWLQVPDADISAPVVSASVPEVLSNASMPSVGGADVEGAAPSGDADLSGLSSSVDLAGKQNTV